MGITRQINIKNRSYYFHNDQTNLKDFDASMLKIDKKITRDWRFLHWLCDFAKKLLIATILTV